MTRCKRNTKLVLLDLDGTVYLGDRLLPGTRTFFARLADAGIDHAFLTNNSTIGPSDYLRKIRRLGLPVDLRSMITSAEASVLMLQHHKVRLDRVYVLGTRKLARYLARLGVHAEGGRPEAVLVGFDTELTYAKLRTACDLLRAGARLFATHPDLNCPTPDGPIPDTGSLLACIQTSTGIRPTDIAGKPNRWVIRLAQKHFGLRPSQMAMIGDNPDTDVRMALRFGLTSVWIAGNRRPRNKGVQADLAVSGIAELIQTPWFRRLTAQ